MRHRTKYLMGVGCPLHDPCKECLVKVMCEDLCDPKIVYDLKHPKPKNIKIKVKRRLIPKRRKL